MSLITYLERKLYYLTERALLGNIFPSVNLISSEIPPKECSGTKSTLSPQEEGLGGLLREGSRLWPSWKASESDPVWADSCKALPCYNSVDMGHSRDSSCLAPWPQPGERGFLGWRLEGEGRNKSAGSVRVSSRCNQLFFSLVPRSDVPADRRAAGRAAPPGPAALRRPVLRVSRSH